MSNLSSIKISQIKYDDILPSSGDKIKLTPFRVGDEKVLLEASESKDFDHIYGAIKSVVSNCVEGIDVDKIETYDLEYLFLRLRTKSVGETSTIGVACIECESMNKIQINLDDVKVVKDDRHSPRVKIQDDLMFEMKFPKEQLAAEVSNATDAMLEIVVASITRVYHGEEVIDVDPTDRADLRKLIESMSKDQFAKIQEFFDTMPKLSKTIEFTCGSCAKEQKTKLEGIQTFLS